MKKIIICALIIAIAYGDNATYAYYGRIEDDKCLQEYRVDSCLYDLLAAITASNAQFYNSATYYYSLEFNAAQNRRSLYIAPEMWNNARTLEYSGFVRVKDVLFLCKGNFKNDSLFHSTGVVKRVTLKLTKNEIGLLKSFNEPSLEGTLKICKGSPIDVSIYTKGKISGYSY